MVDQHEALVGRNFIESGFGVSKAFMAPRLKAFVGCGLNIIFVIADQAVFKGPGFCRDGVHPVGCKRVIVEEKKGDEKNGGIFGPRDIGIFRGDDISFATDFHVVQISFLANEGTWVFWEGVEFVIAGNPNQFFEFGL